MDDLARRAALAYVDAINADDAERLLALFARDGVLRHPAGIFEGHEKLRGFYEGVVLRFATRLSVKAIVSDGRIACLQLEGRSPQGREDQVQYAVDVFRVDAEGRVSELEIYYRNANLAK